MRNLHFLLLLVLNISIDCIAQDYAKNKSSKLIKFDSDVSSLKLKTGTGQKIESFPHIYNNSKEVKYFDLLSDKDEKFKKIIESGFVKNVFITDGLKNCNTCKLPYTGKSKEYDDQDFYINYKKPYAKKADKLSVRILDPVFNIKEKTIIGKRLDNYVSALGESQLYDPIMGSKSKFVNDVSDYLSEKENSYLRPKTFSNKLKTVEAAKSFISVKPQVDMLYFDIYKSSYSSEKDNPDKNGVTRYFSTGDLLINWKFMKPDGQQIFNIPTRVIASTKFSDPNSLFEYLVNESLESLLSHDSLYSWVKKQNAALSFNYTHQKIILTKKKTEALINSKAIVKAVTPCVVTVYNSEAEAFGSGFVISSNGYIVTNYHVIENGDKIKVQFHNDTTKYNAEVVKQEEDVDLALLKVKKESLPFINIGNSDDVETGETVYAVGTPGDTKLSQSVSKGIISGRREFDDKTYFQTDVSINRGNSGGPLVNEQGEVIGIVVMKMIGTGVEGLSFVIPSNIARSKLALEYK